MSYFLEGEKVMQLMLGGTKSWIGSLMGVANEGRT